jgi:multiple sugar transport system substrate-binding protein
MNGLRSGVCAGALLLALVSGGALAQDMPGKFDGVTIDAKLIGGQQYEALYARIPEWEAATGAKVNVVSKKNHFDLDKEIKSDIASNSITWCVASNHSSFAPQYPGIYTDLGVLLPKSEIDAFVPTNIAASTLGGKLVMLPRAQFDVSALYYQKSLYEDDAKKAAYKEKTGNDLVPPDTWEEVSRQAEFFASPPDFYGTQFAGKEEAINGRFYEMLVAEGGEYLDADGKPAFNTEAGVRALDWFVNLYKAKASPRAPWRSTSTGPAGPASSTTPRRPRSPAMSASRCSPWVRRASAPAGPDTTASRSPRTAPTRRLLPRSSGSSPMRKARSSKPPPARCPPAPQCGHGTSSRPPAIRTRRRF